MHEVGSSSSLFVLHLSSATAFPYLESKGLENLSNCTILSRSWIQFAAG
jgi:hypothetical protein